MPPLRNEYRNRCREILDLFCDDVRPNGGQFFQLVDEYVAIMHPAGQRLGWPELDQCLWNFHPRTADKGAFYRNPVKGGPDGNWERKLATPDFMGFAKLSPTFAPTRAPPARRGNSMTGSPRATATAISSPIPNPPTSPTGP